MPEVEPIKAEAHPSSRILPGRHTPLRFICALALVVLIVVAVVVLLLTYGPAFTSHPPGAVQSDRPQASGSRIQ